MLGLTALLALAYLLRGALFGRLVASKITAAIAAELGGEYAIESVEGNWITDVVLVRLRTSTPPADGALRDVGFDRARIAFSLREVFGDPVRALRGVEIEGLRVVLGASPRDPPAGAAPGVSVGEILAGIPRPLPPIDVRGSALVRTSSGDWIVGHIHAKGGATSLALELGDVVTPLSGVAGGQGVRGTLDWSAPGVLLWTSQDEFAGVTASALTVTAGPGRTWKLDARVAVAGGTAKGSVSDSGFEVNATALELARVPAWAHALLGDGDRVLPQTGLADVRADGRDLASVHAIVSARGLGWKDRAIDRLTADVVWRDRRLAVAELDVAGEGASVSARDLVLDPASPLLVVRAGTITASSPDAGALAIRLGLDDVAARLPPEPAAVTVRIRRSAAGRTEIEKLSLDAGSTQVSVTGWVAAPAQPEEWRLWTVALDGGATLALADVRRAAPPGWLPPDSAGSVTGRARVEGELGRLRVTGTLEGTGLRLGGQGVDNVIASAALEGGILTVTRVEMTSRFADVRAEGAFDLGQGVARDTHIEVTARDLSAASHAFPALPQMSGALRVSGTLAGRPPDAMKGALTLRGDALAVQDWTVGAVDAVIALDGTRLTVSHLSLTGPLGTLEAAGVADVASGAFDVPGFRATVPDLLALARRIPGAPAVAGAIEASGSVRRAADARWEEVEGDASIAGTALVAAGVNVSRVEARLRARGGHVDVERLEAAGAFGTFALDGSVDFGAAASRASVHHLELRRENETASLAHPVDVGWSADSLDVGEFETTVSGIGRIRGSGGFAAGAIAARLEATDVDLSSFTARAAGRATMRIEIRGPRAAPEGRFVLDAPEFLWDGERASAVADLTQDAHGLRLERLAVDAGALLRVEGEGHLPLRIGWDGFVHPDAAPPAHLALRLRSTRPGGWVALVTGERIDAASIAVSLVGEGRDLTADVHVTDLRWAGVGREPVHLPGDTVLHAELRAGGISAHLKTAQGGAVAVEGDFRSDAAPDWTDPAGVRSAVRSAPVRGTLALSVGDLAAAVPWLPGVRYLAGRAQGDLTLAGTFDAPQWSGHVETHDVSVLVPGDVAPIDRGDALLRFEGRRILFERLTGRLGSAPVTVTGHIELGDGGAARAELKIAGENVLLVRSHHLRLRADVDLSVTGDLAAPAIAGTARITRALSTQPMDLLGRGAASPDAAFQIFSIRSDPLARARLDVAVTADRTVRVENDLLEADVSLDLRLRGTGEVPVAVGTVTFHGAKVTLPFTTLEVERGQLEFRPGSPFSPVIRAVARASVKGYELNVALSGNVPDVQVSVASSPPLSQASARLLLATGATPTELEREGIAGTALSRAGTLLGGAALSWVRGGPAGRGDSLTDRVRVEVGRDESDSGVKTVTAEFRLAERWFLVAERDRYEDYDTGIVWRLRFP